MTHSAKWVMVAQLLSMEWRKWHDLLKKLGHCVTTTEYGVGEMTLPNLGGQNTGMKYFVFSGRIISNLRNQITLIDWCKMLWKKVTLSKCWYIQFSVFTHSACFGILPLMFIMDNMKEQLINKSNHKAAKHIFTIGLKHNEWWRMPSSGMLRHVVLVRTDVLVERIVSIIRVTGISELVTSAVISNWSMPHISLRHVLVASYC
jgi:hypothetical protein